MTPYRKSHRRLSLRAENGFTLIEVMAATFVLVVGALGMVGAFDSAHKLNLLSERRTSMAHRAQLEIERLQAMPFSELAMSKSHLPSHSTVSTSPDYYVKEGTPLEYQYGSSSTETEKLIESSSGAIYGSPTGRECSASTVGACEWKDGNVKGNVYDFVTSYSEPSKLCTTAEKCPRRLTVVVTANVPSGNHEPTPLRVSTLITNQES